jgi:hypothetical protein
MSTLNNVFKKLEHTEKVAKVNLESQKVELATGDVEGNKIETIWKEGQQVRSTVLKDAISKVNVYVKQMVDLRVQMFKDKEEFSRKYKDLIGESADNTEQVKSWNNQIKIADARINELKSFVGDVQNII